jgi:penicillin-binding protein 2
MTEHSRVRVSIVGVIVIVLFSALLTRLWFLQVDANAEQLAIELDQKSVREVYYESPRGWIYDRDGRVIVQNRVVWVIKIDRRLTDDKLDQAVGRLAELLGKPRADIVARLEDPRISPLEDALIAVDIPDDIRTEISEHREHYPYIQVEQAAVREYPVETTLAPVLGFVGRVNQDDLDRHPDLYGARDTIGRGGIEAAMEADLRGERAFEKLEINPAGEIIGDALESVPGTKGDDVYLTIDLELQQQVERSLKEGIDVARRTQNEDLAECCLVNFRATSAAAVVLDVTTGEVLAMASLPSYNPNEFVEGVSEQRWLELRDKEGDPLFNRATKGGLAPGSTFKLVTSIAGAGSGVRSPEIAIADADCYRNQTGDQQQPFCNPGKQEANRGNPMDMSQALAISSDTYFYEIGDLLWGVWNAGDERVGDAIQHTARDLGFGEKTGIEIGESSNRVPDAQWRHEYTHAQADAGVEPYASNVNDWDDWNPADNINLAVGQGDLTASPLQLVGAYGAFANGGRLWRPYLVQDVRDQHGDVVRSTEPVVRRQIDVPANVALAITNGLTRAVSEGTAQRAFDGFDLTNFAVVGKTGTAQRSKYPGCATPKVAGEKAHTPEEVSGCLGDTSWFVGVAPTNAPKYAVVVMVEEGGFGGDIAAPIARQIFEELFGMPITTIPDVPDEGQNR